MSDTKDDEFEPKAAFRKISASLDQPDKFAEIFCSAAKTQKNIDTTLKDIMRDLLKNDRESRELVKDMLREVEKEDWKFFIKKSGGIVWTLGSIAFGAVLTAVLRLFFP